MASAMPDPWLPSQPQSTATAPWLVLISHPTDGRRLSLLEWLIKSRKCHAEDSNLKVVTHLSTNWACHGVTSLMRPMTLSLCQTTTLFRW